MAELGTDNGKNNRQPITKNKKTSTGQTAAKNNYRQKQSAMDKPIPDNQQQTTTTDKYKGQSTTSNKWHPTTDNRQPTTNTQQPTEDRKSKSKDASCVTILKPTTTD
jgi:hypothetical protein